tara:strand:+ start:356 stop:742 length:387 start_codon:yes stop_codon:yes gene_type:complete
MSFPLLKTILKAREMASSCKQVHASFSFLAFSNWDVFYLLNSIPEEWEDWWEDLEDRWMWRELPFPCDPSSTLLDHANAEECRLKCDHFGDVWWSAETGTGSIYTPKLTEFGPLEQLALVSEAPEENA